MRFHRWIKNKKPTDKVRAFVLTDGNMTRFDAHVKTIPVEAYGHWDTVVINKPKDHKNGRWVLILNEKPQ